VLKRKLLTPQPTAAILSQTRTTPSVNCVACSYLPAAGTAGFSDFKPDKSKTPVSLVLPICVQWQDINDNITHQLLMPKCTLATPSFTFRCVQILTAHSAVGCRRSAQESSMVVTLIALRYHQITEKWEWLIFKAATSAWSAPLLPFSFCRMP